MSDAEAINWHDEASWPQWVAAPIQLSEPNTAWAAEGEAEARRLTGILGILAVGPVHHIGSTSVPGLIAKPILDFAVAAANIHDASEYLLHGLGEDWVLVPDGLHALPIRLLVRVVDGARHSHVQVINEGDPHLERLVALRDAMRRDPDRRDLYAAAKRDAVVATKGDRGDYTDAKGPVIATILRGVCVEPAPT